MTANAQFANKTLTSDQVLDAYFPTNVGHKHYFRDSILQSLTAETYTLALLLGTFKTLSEPTPKRYTKEPVGPGADLVTYSTRNITVFFRYDIQHNSHLVSLSISDVFHGAHNCTQEEFYSEMEDFFREILTTDLSQPPAPISR